MDTTQSDKIPHEPDEVSEDEIRAFQESSLTERGRRLAIACRSAARLNRIRRKAGLPELQPDPWPESTWQFLAKHAPNGR